MRLLIAGYNFLPYGCDQEKAGRANLDAIGGRDQAGGKTVPAAWAGLAGTMSTPEAKEAYATPSIRVPVG